MSINENGDVIGIFIHRLMDYTTVPAGSVGFINLNLVEMSYTYTLIIVFFIV